MRTHTEQRKQAVELLQTVSPPILLQAMVNNARDRARWLEAKIYIKAKQELLQLWSTT